MRNRSDSANRQFMEENHIKVDGHNVPRPVTTFEEAGLPRYVVDAIL